MGSLRGARTIVLALVAGLVAYEAVLALAAGAVGIPGLVLVRFAEERGAAQPPPGGETVIAKLSQTESVKAPERVAAAAPAPKPAEPAKADPPKPAGEQRLQGLETIPQNTDWDQDEKAEKPEPPKAFAGNAQAGEELPWDDVEPVKFSSLDSHSTPQAAKPAAVTPGQPAQPHAKPLSGGEIEAWLKAKATAVKGENRARPLFHFELWLEPPAEVKQRLVGVSYDFSTPAVQPQSQSSNDQKTGFRVSAGGLACADKITLTLRFKDGGSQRVDVDGCALLG